MNPVVLLPLLAAACIAVPAGHHAVHHLPQTVAYNAAPAVAYHHSAPAAVAYTAQVQVPITKTVHYESRPVVTGYQTSIIKPAIATHTVAAPVFAQPAVVAAPAPVVVAEQPAVAVQPVAVPAAPAPAPVEVAQPAPAPEAVQSDDTAIIENPEFRSAAPVAAVQTVQTANVGFAATPAFTTYAAAPAIHHTYAAAPVVAAPVVVRADAPHFDQLVTKEKVLAPVRTHTHITPQVTQVQPEVTVRKVIQDIPVAQPVVQYTAGPSPVIHQTVHAAPAVHHTYAAVPALHHTYAAAPALDHKFF